MIELTGIRHIYSQILMMTVSPYRGFPVISEVGGVIFNFLILPIPEHHKLIAVEIHVVYLRQMEEFLHLSLERNHVILGPDLAEQLTVILDSSELGIRL